MAFEDSCKASLHQVPLVKIQPKKNVPHDKGVLLVGFGWMDKVLASFVKFGLHQVPSRILFFFIISHIWVPSSSIYS